MEKSMLGRFFLDYGGYKQGRVIAKKLEGANIIADCGVRLGVCETTRKGMKEDEMEMIAGFIKRVIVDKEDPRRVKKDVTKLTEEFQEIKYCFM